MRKLVIGKHGEKELQMIFGLFVLLIITLVVLNLFLNTAGESGNKINTVAAKELNDQQIDRLKLACDELCNKIEDENSAIEFCASYQSLDQDQNKKKAATRVTYGKYEFCSNKVPCFLITESCKGGQYTADRCQKLLLNDPATYDLYDRLANDPGFDNQIGLWGWTDGCGLTDPDAPGADPGLSLKNWKNRFQYLDRPIACATIPGLSC